MKKSSRIFVLVIIFVATIGIIKCVSNNNNSIIRIETSSRISKIISKKNELGTIFGPTKSVRKYYYNQLTPQEQEVYNNLKNAKEQIIDNKGVCIGRIDTTYSVFDEDVSLKIDEIVTRIIWAYKLDNPEATLWINNLVSYTITYYYGDNLYFTIIIAPEENKYYDFKNEKQLYKAIKNIENETKEFVQKLNGTDEEKLLEIHNWLIKDSKYDQSLEKLNNDNIYGGIINKECICSGYMYSFKYIADMAEIPVISVIGKVPNNENTVSENFFDANHGWNIAFLDGEWYVIDVTFDVSEGQKFFKVQLNEYGNIPTKMFELPK